MKTAKYQVFGVGIPVLLDRSKEVAAIRRQWRNNHVSVIGPKFFGKTILLRHLQALGKSDGFADVVYWDLRHPVPESDEQFYSLFCKHLREQSPTLREYLPPHPSAADTSEAVYDAFETIQTDDKAVLVILQSMDEMLLRGDTINPNLWDQLAALAELSSIRFLISSRRKLIELVPSQRAKLSDFWRRIGYVCPLGAFGEADVDHLLEPLSARQIKLDKSARKELLNWSGGIPPLMIGLCELLEKHEDGATLTKNEVDAAANTIDSRYPEELWATLALDVRERYAELCEKNSLPTAEFDPSLLNELRAHGLVAEQHGQLKSTSRLLDGYAHRVMLAHPELRRLFGQSDEYLANARRVLSVRVVQVAGFDSEIKSHLNAILQELDEPDAATKMLSGIFDRCADLILRKDFPKGRIDPEWVKDWESRDRLNSRNRDVDSDILRAEVPRHRGARMKLLSLLRDDKIAGSSKARPSTLCLLDCLLEKSNYARHAFEMGETVPLSFACAAVFSTLELCGQLAEDLK